MLRRKNLTTVGFEPTPFRTGYMAEFNSQPDSSALDRSAILPHSRRLSYIYLTGHSLHFSRVRCALLVHWLVLLVCPPTPYTRDHKLIPKIGV